MKKILKDLSDDFKENEKIISKYIDKLSTVIARLTSHSITFVIALILVIGWLVLGNLCNYSHTWERAMTCVTGSIIFLMMFILQQAQKKDTMSIQIKLNEIIASTKGASNKVLNIEDMSAEELFLLKKFYARISEVSGKTEDLGEKHTVDEDKSFKEELKKEGDL